MKNSDPASDAVDAPVAGAAFLTLGHVLAAIGVEHDPPIGLDGIRVIRHSFNTGEELGLRGPEDLTEDRVREYTRFQGISPRQFPAKPERYWVVLVADGQRRSRLWGAFENHGEITAERTQDARFFDLRQCDFLKLLVNRLVVEWDTPRVWHRRAASAAGMPVLEIADRDQVPFQGFDKVLLTFHELGGLSLADVGSRNWRRLWLRGGFPLAYLDRSDAGSFAWRRSLVQTYLERDLPSLGFTTAASTLQRFWSMVAHCHGQVWNASDLASSFRSRRMVSSETFSTRLISAATTLPSRFSATRSCC